MKRFVLAVTALATLAVLAATPAGGAVGQLPGGTSITVDITSPVEGAFVEAGAPLTVTGTASVDSAETAPDTTIVYLIDVSGSMNNSAGEVSCPTDNEGTPSRLDCAKQAAKTVNAAAAGSGTVKNAAVIGFNANAPAGNSNAALTDLASEGGASIVDGRIDALTANGGTSFQAGINAANNSLQSEDAGSKGLIVIISDGISGGEVSNPLPAGTVIEAFAIGGNGCSSGPGSLQAVADLVGANGACTEVDDENLGDLGGIIGEAIGSELTSITVAVCDDFGEAVECPEGQVPATITSPEDTTLPTGGPAYVEFTATIPPGQLGLGPNLVCATASGSDAGGAGSVEDCVTVEVVDDAVDCGAVPAAQCTVAATDDGVADAVVTGLGGFDKNLAVTAGLENGADEDCLGQECITGFNVQFPDEGVTGTGKVVQVVVVMSRENSVPPGRAKAFLEVDGVTTEITNRCGGRNEQLPCAKINRVSGGRTQYLVKFDGDPWAKFR